MTDRLDVWLEGQHAGRFDVDRDGVVRFEYSETAPRTPISLSLPRDGVASKGAAGNFLENLLPDHQSTRARMASVYGAASTRTMDLLAKAGGDIAGGLVLTPAGEPAPTGPLVLNPALTRDVADRINSIKRDPDSWVPRDVPARFSLAGTQGKFAVALIDGDWYWSNATVPSTHIVKPGRPELRNIETAEVAALQLASAAGVPAPAVDVLHADDQTAFMIQRFDREPGEGVIAGRLHAEDLAQALGVGPDSKYGVTAKQVAELLEPHDADGSLIRGFLAQLAFNTVVGNADAHAKNYSVLLRPDGVTLAPLYDVVPVGLYPNFDQKLAMRIAGARFPQAASPEHWRKLARNIGFDEDEMTDVVAGVASRVAELNSAAWENLDEDQAVALREIVERNAVMILTGAPSATTAHLSSRGKRNDGQLRG